MFVISNTCGVQSNCPGQNREADEEHDEDCVEEMVRDIGKLLGWAILVSIFEIGQNWNQLDPGKTFRTLKTIFQYFCYLLIQTH